jgi:hypothetical protein
VSLIADLVEADPLSVNRSSGSEAVGAAGRDAAPLSQGPGEQCLLQLLVPEQVAQELCILLSEADMADKQALGARANRLSQQQAGA